MQACGAVTTNVCVEIFCKFKHIRECTQEHAHLKRSRSACGADKSLFKFNSFDTSHQTHKDQNHIVIYLVRGLDWEEEGRGLLCVTRNNTIYDDDDDVKECV